MKYLLKVITTIKLQDKNVIIILFLQKSTFPNFEDRYISSSSLILGNKDQISSLVILYLPLVRIEAYYS